MCAMIEKLRRRCCGIGLVTSGECSRDSAGVRAPSSSYPQRGPELEGVMDVASAEDEFFIVLEGEVRVRHGDDVIEAVAGSAVYGPRGIPHAFGVDSSEARLLLFSGPAGVEGFFRDGGEFVGPPLLPKT